MSGTSRIRPSSPRRPAWEDTEKRPIQQGRPNLRLGILPGADPALDKSKEEDMGVKFLSEEWAKAVEDALNANEQFKNSAGSTAAKVQQVVTTPDGEKKS